MENNTHRSRMFSFFKDHMIEKFERAFGILGIGILSWMIYRIGPHLIANNFHKVGFGFFVLVLSKGVAYLCEALSWKLILAEKDKRVSFFKLAKVLLEGESLNYITLTRMGGEALKAVSLKEDIPMVSATASVIVLKFCNLFSFWLVISLGFLTILFRGHLTGEIEKGLGMEVVLISFFILWIAWRQKKGMFKPISWILNKFQSKRDWVEKQVMRLTDLDDKIIETYRSKSSYIITAIFLNSMSWLEEIFFMWFTFHLLHIDEIWIVLVLIVILSLLLNSLFFFVPWRAGTQEGTMVLTFSFLQLSEPLGLSLAIIRRTRELVWVFFGLVIFSLETIGSSTRPIPQSQ